MILFPTSLGYMLSKPVHHVVCIRQGSSYCKWQESNFIWLCLRKKYHWPVVSASEGQGSVWLQRQVTAQTSSAFLNVGSILPIEDKLFSSTWRYGNNTPRHPPFVSSPLQGKKLAFLGFNLKNTQERRPAWVTCHSTCTGSRILWLAVCLKNSFWRWVRSRYSKERLIAWS